MKQIIFYAKCRFCGVIVLKDNKRKEVTCFDCKKQQKKEWHEKMDTRK